MPRPSTPAPAEIDRLVEKQVRVAAQAVYSALRAVEQAHTTRSRRVARHLAGVLRMLQDTGRVTSPFDPAGELVAAPVPKATPPAPPPASPTPEVGTQDE